MTTVIISTPRKTDSSDEWIDALLIFRPDLIRIETIIRIKTRIAGYCASSTECSDHSLKKIQKKTFKLVLFFICMLRWKDQNEKQSLGLFDCHKKKVNWKQFLKKIDKKNKKMKNFAYFFWISKILIPKLRYKLQKLAILENIKFSRFNLSSNKLL